MHLGLLALASAIVILSCSKDDRSTYDDEPRFSISSESTYEFDPNRLTLRNDPCSAPGLFSLELEEKKGKNEVTLLITSNLGVPKVGATYRISDPNLAIQSSGPSKTFSDGEIHLSVFMMKSENGTASYGGGRVDPQVIDATIKFNSIEGDRDRYVDVEFSLKLYGGKTVIGQMGGLARAAESCQGKPQRREGFNRENDHAVCYYPAKEFACTDIGDPGKAPFENACRQAGGNLLNCGCSSLCDRRF